MHTLETLTELGPTAQHLAKVVIPLLDDPLSAQYAARCLGALRVRAALPALIAQLTSPDAETRVAAISAMYGNRAVRPARSPP